MRNAPRSRVAPMARVLLAAMAATPLLLLLPGGAEGAKAPRVDFVWEGRSAGDVPLLVLEGKGLKKVAGAILQEPDGDPGGVLGVISPGSTTVKLLLPPDLPPGDYDLLLEMAPDYAVHTIRVRLSGGRALPGTVTGRSLGAALRSDLDDADLLVGKPGAHFRNAGNVEAGVLPLARFSAMQDLEDEGAVSGGRIVTPLFSAWEDLGAEGHVAGALAPLLAGSGTDDPVAEGTLSPSLWSAWDDLAAEGRVDGNGILGTGSYSAWADLEAEGRAATGQWTPGMLDAWADLLAEGHRDGTGLLKTDRFSAWDDLVAEARVGLAAGKVAPGIHDHDAAYLNLTGDALTGGLKVEGGTGVTTGKGALLVETADSPVAVWCWSSGKIYGIHGVNGSTADGGAAVRIEMTGSRGGLKALEMFTGGPDHGMVGRATALSGATVGLRLEGNGTGTGGFYTSSNGTNSKVLVRAETKGGGGTALRVRGPSTAGDLLRCLDYSPYPEAVVARIDGNGKGWFDGGLATSGADFAESVRASPAIRFPEAGDVVVVDPGAVRGFALCAERMSTLVAGVVSTRPGVLAAPRNVSCIDTPPDEVALAVAGIVPVKASAENGPLAPGDELVAASLPGHAMKAPPGAPAGSVVGKCLGALEEGLGTVEVLLTLR